MIWVYSANAITTENHVPNSLTSLTKWLPFDFADSQLLSENLERGGRVE